MEYFCGIFLLTFVFGTYDDLTPDRQNNETEIEMKPSTVILIYGLTAITMVIIAQMWSWFRQITLWSVIKPSCSGTLIGIVLAVAFVVANLGFYYAVADKKWFHAVKVFFEQILFPLLKPLSWPQMLLMSIIAGFSEELFFRGVIQADLGIILASLVFGLLHTYSPKIWIYGLWVVVMGISLGLVVLLTGDLFIAMVTHAVYDFLILLIILKMQVKNDTIETS